MRDPSIDWLRGALILGVLLVHADVLFEPRDDTMLSFANAVVGPVLMPTVFAISGYLTNRTIGVSTWAYLQSKAVRLLWPYLVWVVLYSPVLLFVEKKFDSPVDIVRAAIVSPSELGPVWFLIYLFAFSAAVYVFRFVPAWLMLAIALATSTVFSLVFGGGPAVLVHLSGFLLGLTYREWRQAWTWTHTVPRVTVASVSTVSFLVMPVFLGDSNRDNVGATWLVVLGCLTLLLYRRVMYQKLGTDWLLGIGNNSLQYFLPHWPVMLLIHAMLPARDTVTGVYASVLLGVGLSLLVGYALARAPARIGAVDMLFNYPGRKS